MTPFKHQICNDVLLKPKGATEEECGDLHIFRDTESNAVWSFWKPNAEELVALNRGGCVAMCVQGVTHPPLFIATTQPTEEQGPRITHESEYCHRMEAMNGRLAALLSLTKRIVSAWTRENPGTAEHRSLTDQFLDFLNANRTDGTVVKENPNQPKV